MAGLQVEVVAEHLHLQLVQRPPVARPARDRDRVPQLQVRDVGHEVDQQWDDDQAGAHPWPGEARQLAGLQPAAVGGRISERGDRAGADE